MTRQQLPLLTLGLSLLCLALPAQAHHSFPAQYDANKRTTLTGTVTRVDWANPHIYFYADVTDEETGEVTNYAFEMGGINSLIRLGWTRDSLKAGDVVTVEGALARDGSPLVNASEVTMAKTGRRMFAGSSQNE
jgi:hypothetical protein